jgi:hypothetical protein
MGWRSSDVFHPIRGFPASPTSMFHSLDSTFRHSDIQTSKLQTRGLLGYRSIDPSCGIPRPSFPPFLYRLRGDPSSVAQLPSRTSLAACQPQFTRLDFPLIPLFFLSPRGSLLDSRCRDSRPLDTTVDDALPKHPKHPRILKVGLLGNKSRLVAHRLLHETAALCVPDRQLLASTSHDIRDDSSGGHSARAALVPR